MSMSPFNPDDLNPEQRAAYEEATKHGDGKLMAVDLDDYATMQRYFDTYLEALEQSAPADYIQQLDVLGGNLLVLNEGFKMGFRVGMYVVLGQLGHVIGTGEGPRRPGGSYDL